MNKYSTALGIFSAILSSVLTANTTFAANGAWTGNGANDSWNNSNNWTAAFPVAGNTATFNATVSNSTVSMNGTSVNLTSIAFNTNAGSYTFNAGGGSLTLTGAVGALTVNANTTGNVTQTFNVAVGLSSATSTAAFTNNGTDVFLDFAGGVNSGTSSRTVSFTGTGRGGRVNGLTQGGGDTSITFGGSGAWEFSGTSNASGNLTISTTGGLLISGNLSSTARTTLSGRAMINNDLTTGGLSAIRLTQSGTLEAYGADRTINTGNHTLDTNATFAGSNTITIASLATIGGSTGSLINNITGTGKSLVFTNANFYLADTEAARTRVIGGSGTTEIQSNITNNAVGNTFASGIQKQGTGTLILSGSNSYTGGTTIQGGALVLNSANAMTVGEISLSGGVLGLGAGNFTRSLATGNNNFRWLSGGTGGGFAAYGADRSVNVGGAGAGITWGATSFIQVGQTFMLGAADSTHTLTYVNPLGLGSATRTIQVADGTSSSNVDGEFSGVLSGVGGGINKTGAGTLLLSANNSYSGETLLAAGTLALGHANALGTGGNISFSGGTLQYGANNTADYSGRLVGSGSAVKIDTNSQSVTYASALASSNTGGLEKIGSGTLVLAGNNTYTGGTTITVGTLQIGNGGTAGSLVSSSTISNSGILAFNRSDTLTQGTDFSNTITGTGALLQNGSGTLVLSANNTYSGATTIHAGTIQLTGSISSSATTVNSGGTLMGNGTAGTVTINSGGIISPGNSPGTITVGNSIWEGGGNYNWQLYDSALSAGTGWDFISSTGSLTLNATSGNKFNINLWSLSGINPDTNGNALGFNASTSTSWNIASFAGGISGFSSDIFLFNTAATNGTGGFTASGQLGTFSMQTGNNTLTLIYTAPSASGLWVGGSGNWTTAANWQGTTVPVNGSPIEFAGSGGTSTNNNALAVVNGISFSASANGSYTIDGSALEIATGGLLNSSAYEQTVALNLTMNGSSSFNADTADLTISGGVDNNGSTLTATANTSRTISISGAVSDSGSLIKNGAGTLILTGNNTYGGSTTISLGTLQIGNNSAGLLGAGNYAGTIANSGTLAFSSTQNQTLSGLLSGDGALVKSSSGTLVLTAANSFSGNITINAGTLEVGGSGVLENGNLANGIVNNGTLSINTSANQTLAGVLSGSGALNKSNSGTLTLSSSNSYTGATTIQAGIVSVGSFGNGSSAGSFGASSNASQNLILSGGTILYTGVNATSNRSFTLADGTSSTINVSTSGVSLTLSGNSAATTGSLVKAGSGTLVLGGNNSYTGSTTISAGALHIGSGAKLGGGNYGGNISNQGTLQINVDPSDNLILSGTISGSGNLRKIGNGILSLSGNSSFSGGIAVDGGTIRIGHDNALGTGVITMTSNPTFTSTDATDRVIANAFSGFSTPIFGAASGQTGNLTFTNTGSLAITGTRVVTVQNTTSIATSFTGTALMTKNGTGTLVLVGNNTYTGGTTINAGTLQIGNGGTTGSLSATGAISNNATLVFNRTDSITQGTDFSSSGISGSGAVIKNGAGNLTFNTNNTYTGGTVINAGTLQIGNGGTTGSLSATGTIINNATLVFNRTDSITQGTDFSSSGISGSGAVVQNGTGNLTFNTSNTYSGSTTVERGTLTAAHANALGSNATINVNGGSLLVAADGAINGKNITLNNTSTTVASLAFSGNYSGTIGRLTLSADSMIDLGTGSVSAAFADIAMGVYSLSIYNWSGTTLWNGGTGNDTDRIYFGTGTYTLSNVHFYSGNVGSDSFLGTGFDLGYVPGLGDQIIPVPEPGVWFVGLVLLVGAIFHMVRQGACSKQMDPSPFYDKNADAGSETKNPIARVRAFFWVGNL
jgi:autotransporter-associated beta strand protein